MRALPVASQGDEPVDVDVCAECGGAILEFFDGEASHVAREALRRGQDARQPMAEPPADLSCPDCEAPMQPAPYLGDGPVVARCAECLCLFATPTDLKRLASYAQEREAEGLLPRIRRALGLR